MEELKQALKEYNMGDEQTIKEIISEVDVDCVSFIYFNSFFPHCLVIYQRFISWCLIAGNAIRKRKQFNWADYAEYGASRNLVQKCIVLPRIFFFASSYCIF